MSARQNTLGFYQVEGNQFYENRASSSAGLYISSGQDSYVRTIAFNNFINNRGLPASGEGGGLGIYSSTNSQWDIHHNEFINNGWYLEGNLNGGAMILQYGQHYIHHNRFIHNQGTNGSAVLARQYGFVQFDSNLVMNHFGNNAIYFFGTSFDASNNDFINNLGITISGSPATAINNYWGHPLGPRTASNPEGQGDSLPDGIPYIPFRTTPVFPELPVKDFGDYGSWSERGQNGSGLPNTITIEKVYPNPTNSILTMNYTLSRPQLIVLKLYDTYGREEYSSLPQLQIAGSHTFSLQTDGIASGLYFLKLSSTASPTNQAMQKVVLLK